MKPCDEIGDGGTSRMDVQSVEEWSAALVGGKAAGGEMAYAASRGGDCHRGGEWKEKGKGKPTLLHFHHRAEMDCSLLPKPPHIPSAQAFPSETSSTSLSPSHGHATANTQKGKHPSHLFHSFFLLLLLYHPSYYHNIEE